MGNLNTTESMKKLSVALADKLDYTRENMDRLLEKAGCDKDTKKVRTRIPLNPFNKNDDVLYMGINGVSFYFKRGETMMLAEPLVEQLENCEEL